MKLLFTGTGVNERKDENLKFVTLPTPPGTCVLT